MILLLALACHRPAPADDSSTTPSDSQDSTQAPPSWSTDPCLRVEAGPAGTGTAAELAAMHTTVRLFGTAPDAVTADAAFATMLQAEAGLVAPDLDPYAAAVGDACALDASSVPLGAASVEAIGDVAWVHPGTGAVTLPAGTAAVAVDLRGLPDLPELHDALVAAVGVALATDAAWAGHEVRGWNGYVDQVFSSTNVYTVGRVDVPAAPLPAAGGTDLPLLLVTGERLAPAAAELAAALRSTGRAWIVGADVPTGVGELRWSPVGTRGIATRTMRLLDAAGEPLPDVFPADLSTSEPETVAADWASWSAPAAVAGPADRARVANRHPFDEVPPAGDDLGTYRAALLVQHGVLRRFFPYFDLVGDTIDARLDEVLDGLVPGDRCDLERRVGRLGNALHDGHMFFGDFAAEGACGSDEVGYFATFLDHVGTVPVVAQSGMEGVHLGDAVVAVDGVPEADLQADWLTWHGGATPGYALDVADRGLYPMKGPSTFTLADPDGVERDVILDPVDADAWYAVPYAPHARANGRLDDLGAGDVGYLNLDGAVTTTIDQVKEAVEAADGAQGLVVDMRGYPAVNTYQVLPMLLQASASTPQFGVPTWSGPDAFEVVWSQSNIGGNATPNFAGPLVLLVFPATVSAAENFAIMLVSAGREVTVVGRPSAGTNGNITGATLPGAFYATFTGMDVRFPDGATFHGVGIVPDIVVAPTAADYRDGRDPELLRAIEVVRGG